MAVLFVITNRMVIFVLYYKSYLIMRCMREIISASSYSYTNSGLEHLPDNHSYILCICRAT